MKDSDRSLGIFGLAAQISSSDIKAPRNGAPWKIFSLKKYAEMAKKIGPQNSWKGVPRHTRQNGKIEEAQYFRRAQGYYLKARLHFFKISQNETGYLRWWFSDLDRVLIHHILMVNYYLHDRPTNKSELIAFEICSPQKLTDTLKNAVDMGSLEMDQLKGDRRAHCFYPSRGLVADTDMLFGRKGTIENEGIYRHWNRQLKADVDLPCHATPQMLDEYLEKYDAYFEMVGEYIPDMAQPPNTDQ